ncbi:MAG TPA: magnesium chelatase [Bacteroidetes bacterium]|nr:magnesium chelatase [Bacteroidota bacterium]HRK04392.1 MoxR family ATPase [Chlorobiota bacterium]
MTERPHVTAIQAKVDSIRNVISNIIVGQPAAIDMFLAALVSNGHILVEGPPGVAKTLLARLMAKLVDVPFTRIQFTPDLMPADITGTSVFDPRTLEFTYRKGPVFASVVLADEINRAPAKTQAALFEAMEERQVTVDGSTYGLPDPFMVVATQNPIEQEGTYRLPEAQLDRFLIKILVPYPTVTEEADILRRHGAGSAVDAVSQIQSIISAGELAAWREAVRTVIVEDSIINYIATIVHATRTSSALYIPASPRASLGILTMAKAMAVLQGRDFVVPDDVQSVAAPVLRHRIQLLPEREMEGYVPDSVVRDILKTVEVPR